MFSNITVPLDGSELAAACLPYAEALARVSSGRLYLVRAIGADGEPYQDEFGQTTTIAQQATDYLLSISQKLAVHDIPAEPHVYPGVPVLAILEAARAHKSDLIVMSTHGRSGPGRWMFGSVAEAVLRTADRPVLLAAPHCDRKWNSGTTVIVPVDGSALAEEAIEPATQLASALGATVTLAQAMEPPNPSLYGATIVSPPDKLFQSWLGEMKMYLERLAAGVRAKGIKVHTDIEVGDPAVTIARLAREREADAIAMATHGRTGLARVVTGSVAAGIVQRANVPILMVRPSAMRPSVETPASMETTGRAQATVDLGGAELQLIKESLQYLLTSQVAEERHLTEPINHLLNRLPPTEQAEA